MQNGESSRFLSIIVPIYNAQDYIQVCLDSLLKQNYDDYEIICVNDGSTDNTLSILMEYEKKNSRIRVIDKENGGVSSARNVGIEAARGDYIWFVDGDDCIKPNCLSYLLSIAHSEKCEIMSVQDVMFDENLSLDEILTINAQDKNLDNIECIAFKIFKSEIIKQNNILFDETITHGEDNIFIYEFMKHKKSIL